MMASTITRRQCFSGRRPRPAVLSGAGNSGSRIAHSASVTDDEYTAQPCPPAAWGGHDGHGEIGSWSGRDLVHHRPNQEATSSVLREAHARPSRLSKHSLSSAASVRVPAGAPPSGSHLVHRGFVAAGCSRFIVFADGSVMRYCRFFALAAVSSTRSRECIWFMAASRLWTLRPEPNDCSLRSLPPTNPMRFGIASSRRIIRGIERRRPPRGQRSQMGYRGGFDWKAPRWQ